MQQVFERLGPSLYDFLRKNSYRSFPIDLVRELGRQILESVACVWIILALFLICISMNYEARVLASLVNLLAKFSPFFLKPNLTFG